MVKLLDLGTSIYNIEVREGVDGKAYIMEMAPRGGNRLSEMVKYATGVDLIKNAVKAAVGITDLDMSQKTMTVVGLRLFYMHHRVDIFKK